MRSVNVTSALVKDSSFSKGNCVFHISHPPHFTCIPCHFVPVLGFCCDFEQIFFASLVVPQSFFAVVAIISHAS